MNNMKIALLGTVVAAGIAISGGSAFAADLRMPMHSEPAMSPALSGLYASVFAGAVFPQTVTGQYFGSSNLDLQTQTGYAIGAAVGTHVTPNLRAELEFSYVHHGVSDDDFMSTGFSNFRCSGLGGCAADGSLSTLYMLGNAWYDIDMGNGFTPYVGGGVGAALVMPDLVLYGDPKDVWNQARLAPAGQLRVGVKWNIADNLALDVGYRAKAVMAGVFAEANSCKNACSAVGVSYVDQTVQAGLTFGF
jgi:outer membrane immunogenic protein